MELISKQGHSLLFTSYVFNLYKIFSCHTLEMSRKTPLTSIVASQSKAKCILLTIEN